MAGVVPGLPLFHLPRARARSRRATGFSLLKFLKYIGEEILIVLGTSSSESVLPRLMAKLEYLGCAKPVVGLVVPAGYSFNLDGTADLHDDGRDVRRAGERRRSDAGAGARDSGAC